MPRAASFAAWVVACVLSFAAQASAEERCLPYEEFNAWAETTGGAAVRGRLVFDFTAPSLIDRYRADAVIVDMADFRAMTPRGTACSGWQMKSWGDCRLPDDTRCTCSGMRCDGVIKLEGFDECGTSPGEAPFTPWHSEPVFTVDGRACHLELFFDEAASGYDLSCDGIVVAPGRGENEFGTEITQISVLENVGGGNAFDGAVLTSAAIFCWDDGVPAASDAGTSDAGTSANDASAVDAASESDASRDGATSDGGRGSRSPITGCGCATGRATPRMAWLAAIAALAALGARRRRT